MSRRATTVVSAACALVAVVCLVVAGSHRFAVRTFALDAPNQFPVAVLRPGSRVCEGPVTSAGSAQSVRIWGAPAGSPANLTLEVHGTAPAVLLASGRLSATAATTEATVRLNRPIPGGRALTICLVSNSGAFTLAGYPAVNPAVVMVGPLAGPQPGPEPGHEFSLVLLSSRNRSLLSALPTAFTRASLWRASWVGNWTFWVLTFALLATFGLGAVAVVFAASDDARGDDTRRRSVGEGAPPSTDGEDDAVPDHKPTVKSEPA